MRPIINNIGSVTYKLAKWLVTQFQPFDNFETHNIRNSLDLVEKIRDIQLSDKDKLVSFDVVNLFPSVPKQQILKLLIKWLQEIGMKEEEIEENRMLTELCLNVLNLTGKFISRKKACQWVTLYLLFLPIYIRVFSKHTSLRHSLGYLNFRSDMLMTFWQLSMKNM